MLCYALPEGPYTSMKGGLKGIRFARENDRPFLGPCSGFQHAALEFARNVMGTTDAEHAEEHSPAHQLFITPLTCSLEGSVAEAKIVRESLAVTVYDTSSVMERFSCNYGLNPLRRTELEKAGLQFSGFDINGDVRIVELPKARFFLATLFVPPMNSTPTQPHPIITDLFKTALKPPTRVIDGANAPREGI